MIYIDTSMLVPLHLPEVHSDDALLWLARQTGALLVTSEWTAVEFASALSRKMRSGALSSQQRTTVELALAQTMATHVGYVVGVYSEDYTAATKLLARPDTGLRAGDALHLAVAQRLGARLATLDVVLGAAAATFGVPVETIA